MPDREQERLVVPGLSPLPPQDRKIAVLDALARLIAETGAGVGDRLPTEREMMVSLGVGRSTIREAMREWSALGIVEVRKGSGVYLRRPMTASSMPMSFLIDTAKAGLLHTIEVRRGLETEAGALAAVRATPGQIAELESKLDRMEAVFLEQGTAGPEDLAFHSAIYEISGNPLFGQILAGLREAFERLFGDPFRRPDFARGSFPFHRELFEAIAGRDPEAARAHTLAILEIVEDDINRMSDE